MDKSSALNRRINLRPLARYLAAKVCDLAYALPHGRTLTMTWDKPLGRGNPPNKMTSRHPPAEIPLPGQVLDAFKYLDLTNLSLNVTIVKEGSEAGYDNNFYYGDLGIHASLPPQRSKGQASLTANLIHELTHALQSVTLKDYEGVGSTDPIGYALDPLEVEAHLKEFKAKARGTKTPIEDIVVEHWADFFEGDESSAKLVANKYLKALGKA